MSVNFSENTKFGEKAQIEVNENGGNNQSGAYGARRMSRRGSVMNNSASAPTDGTLVHSDRAYSSVAETLPVSRKPLISFAANGVRISRTFTMT